MGERQFELEFFRDGKSLGKITRDHNALVDDLSLKTGDRLRFDYVKVQWQADEKPHLATIETAVMRTSQSQDPPLDGYVEKLDVNIYEVRASLRFLFRESAAVQIKAQLTCEKLVGDADFSVTCQMEYRWPEKPHPPNVGWKGSWWFESDKNTTDGRVVFARADSDSASLSRMKIGFGEIAGTNFPKEKLGIIHELISWPNVPRFPREGWIRFLNLDDSLCVCFEYQLYKRVGVSSHFVGDLDEFNSTNIARRNVDGLTIETVERKRILLQRPDPHARYGRGEEQLYRLEVPGVRAASVIECWNSNIANPHLKSLRTAKDGQPASFMPTFAIADEDKADWTLVIEISDRVEGTPRQVRYQNPATDSKTVLSYSFHSFYGPPFDAVCSLPGVRTHSSQFVSNVPVRIEKAEATARGIELTFFQRQAPRRPSKADLIRIGSLDLQIGKQVFDKKPNAGTASAAPPCRVQGWFRLAATSREVADFGQGQNLQIPTVDLSLQLRIETVQPGGQDDLPISEFVTRNTEDGEQNDYLGEQPLLVPAPKSSPAKRDFVLSVSEKTAKERSHSLRMRLELRSSSGAKSEDQKVDVLVIDPNPLTIARVISAELSPDGSETGLREIANWSNTSGSGAFWEVAGNRDGFTLMLPPQGVGEATEKSDKKGHDIDEGQLADFRYSPPAFFKLRSSYFDQRFGEAPWNLRRLLGYPGQRAPGAEILQLDFELLYGMSCSVSERGLRLAEISARLGALPDALASELPWSEFAAQKQKDAYEAYRQTWGSVYAAYLTRLGVLEPWRGGRPTSQEDVIIDQNVEYRLRRYRCLLYTSPSPRDATLSRMPSSA